MPSRPAPVARVALAAALALLTLLGAACEDDTITGPFRGVVSVDVEPGHLEAVWRLAGPGTFRLNGVGETRLREMEMGPYTVTWGAQPGWVAPPPDTLMLDGGEEIRFVGRYTNAAGTVMIDASPDSLIPCWILSGPAGEVVGCGDDTLTAMPPGEYTLAWREIEGWLAPAQGVGEVRVDRTLRLGGDYVPVAVTIEITPQPVGLLAPWTLRRSGQVVATGVGAGQHRDARPGTFQLQWWPVGNWTPEPHEEWESLGVGDEWTGVGHYTVDGHIAVPNDFATIAAALAAAGAGDEVRLAAGVYQESDLRVPDGVTLAGATGREAVIDGQGGDGLVLEAASVTVRGLTLRNCRVAIDCDDDSSVDVADCSFQDNDDRSRHPFGAGGISAAYADTVIVRDCDFTGNRSGDGGAIRLLWNGHAVIAGCTFTDNEGRDGGAIHIGGSRPQISDCTFTDNHAADRGGAIRFAFSTQDTTTITGCTFVGNGAGTRGGAISWDGRPLRLVGCLLAHNATNGRGGAVDLAHEGGQLELQDCTLIRNHAALGSAVHAVGGHVFPGEITLRAERTIIGWGNGAPFTVEEPGDDHADLACSDIVGHPDGDWIGPLAGLDQVNGNFSADPEFCAADAGDYRLQAGSPCLPAGNECGVVVGAFGEGCE